MLTSKLCRLILLFGGFCASTLFAQQDFSHWEALVDWDGVTPWTSYFTVSPAFFGPNALPVPRLQEGRIREEISLEIRPEYHRGENGGDQTYDLYTRLYLPLFSDRVALEVYMVALESYRLDSATSDLRRARFFEAEGVAAGDVYFSTLIQLVKNKKVWPDIVANITLKTASGEDLENARFTDAPGYYFDLSMGKTLTLGKAEALQLRLHGMLGFYVWQTYRTSLRQNDALSFGMGALLENEKWALGSSLSGYIGYIDNGDKPVVVQADLTQKNKRIDWQIGYQHGIHDFPYQSFRMSAILHIPRGKKKPSS